MRVIRSPGPEIVLVGMGLVVLAMAVVVVEDLQTVVDSDEPPESGELDDLLSRRCNFSPQTRPCF